MGKFDRNPDSLPHGEHKPGAVPFKEAENPKSLSVIANVMCIVIIAALGVPALIRCGRDFDRLWLCVGCIASLLTLFPHELLHAVCFKGDVYMYTNLRQGMMFVVGTESMSKARFILMSLLPNIVFGFIPYILGMIFPQAVFLLSFGTLSAGMGAGDYYNVFNALTQMPRGARTYIYKFNSFWYMPD